MKSIPKLVSWYVADGLVRYEPTSIQCNGVSKAFTAIMSAISANKAVRMVDEANSAFP